MQLKKFYLPVLAGICTLSLVDVRPVAAVSFPASLAVGLPVAVQRFAQHMQSDLDPVDFWRLAHEVGEGARRYGEKFVQDTVERSQEILDKVGELTARMGTIVRSATALHEELHTSATPQSRDDIGADLERAFATVLAELEVMFPAPDQAPGHAQRQKVVAVALDKAGTALVGVCTKYGMEEERAREHWGSVRPAIETMVVLIGDLVEQHPDLLETLLFTVTSLLIPEYSLLRPLLGLFGFVPAGPGKETTASWVQRVFYGAAVSKRS